LRAKATFARFEPRRLARTGIRAAGRRPRACSTSNTMPSPSTVNRRTTFTPAPILGCGIPRMAEGRGSCSRMAYRMRRCSTCKSIQPSASCARQRTGAASTKFRSDRFSHRRLRRVRTTLFHSVVRQSCLNPALTARMADCLRERGRPVSAARTPPSAPRNQQRRPHLFCLALRRQACPYMNPRMKCTRCQDAYGVCEAHDDRPWSGEKACGCDGAGMPCPSRPSQ
jgi:hypothetical protein